MADSRKVAAGGTTRLLAGLLASGLSVSLAFAEADTQTVRPGRARVLAAAPAAATSAAGGQKTKVSPYAIANRQHVEAAAAASAPSKSSAARRFTMVAARGQRP